MEKGRKPQEFLFGKRIYYVNKSKNGKGDVYGYCYLPKELIGKRVFVQEIEKEDIKNIEIVKREYSLKKKKEKNK